MRFRLYLLDVTESPIHGGDGNVEYLACFKFDSLPKNTLTKPQIDKINKMFV